MTKKYIPYLSIYRKKLSSYPRKVVRQFHNIAFDKRQSRNMGTEDIEASPYIFKIYGFIIKKDNKFWTINEKKDLVWLFDKIDTEAELYQFLEFNNISSDVYRKTANGYDVKRIEIEYKVDKKTKGAVDEYTDYGIYRTYIYHVKSNGEFSKKLILTQRIDMYGEPMCQLPLPPISLEEILKDKRFVTPSSY